MKRYIIVLWKEGPLVMRSIHFRAQSFNSAISYARHIALEEEKNGAYFSQLMEVCPGLLPGHFRLKLVAQRKIK